MSRPLTRADLQIGDFLLMRADCLKGMSPLDPSRLFCEGILLGEVIISSDSVTPGPVVYFHVAVVEDPAASLTLEETTNGETEHDTNQESAWYDVYRQNWANEAQRAAFIVALRTRLGTRYGIEQFGTIFGVRVLHLPLGHPAYTGPGVCSNTVAEAEADVGVFPWKSRGIDPGLVTPSDFPGDGQSLIARAGVMVTA